MRSLLYIVILFVVTGCTYSSSFQVKALDETERLLLSDPEAAFRQLNQYDVSEFEDSATMARWALLYSEAMVANRLTAPTDTIVNIAIDYYGNHNLKDEFQRASRLKALIKAGEDSDELATALYLQKEKEFMLYKERMAREQSMFIGLIILLVAVRIIIWMRQRLKLQSAKNDVLMAEASGLKLQLKSASDKSTHMQTTLHSLLDNRFSLIDGLCDTYYQTQGTKNERKAIADRVKAEIEAIRTDPMIFSEMEQTVNDCRNNLLNGLKAEFPGIKPEEYQLATFLACGFSSRTISLLLGESIENVYKRKSRLKQRLKGLNLPDEKEFLTIF